MTVTEYMVSGRPHDDVPYFTYVFELADRAFDYMEQCEGWVEGPFLSTRTITTTPWREVL